MTSTAVEGEQGSLLIGIGTTNSAEPADFLGPDGKKNHPHKKNRSDLLPVKEVKVTETNIPMKPRSSGPWQDRADCGQ